MAELQEQIEWCFKSNNCLKNLSYVITSSEQTLETTINMLNSYNFMDFNRLLLPLQSQYNRGSNETQKFIADEHIAFIHKEVSKINEILDEIKAKAGTIIIDEDLK